MMGSSSLACLVLVFAVLQVQSYTLRDAFRDRGESLFYYFEIVQHAFQQSQTVVRYEIVP